MYTYEIQLWVYVDKDDITGYQINGNFHYNN